jgi:hypothetical protein
LLRTSREGFDRTRFEDTIERGPERRSRSNANEAQTEAFLNFVDLPALKQPPERSANQSISGLRSDEPKPVFLGVLDADEPKPLVSVVERNGPVSWMSRPRHPSRTRRTTRISAT